MTDHRAGEARGERIGSVASCRRYPVKSFQGIDVAHLDISEAGVDRDRAWGVLDGAGHVLSAKRTGALLTASATDSHLTMPDGTEVALGDPSADAALSAWLGKPVRLARPDGAGPVSYEMTFDPPDDDAEYYEIPTPPDSFLDLAAVHVVTEATLDGAASARPDLDWDPRRFRPNLVLDVAVEPFGEQAWIGRTVRVGEVTLVVDGPTVRCAMPLRAQPGGLERQPGLFRAMSDLNETFPNHLGLYCSVVGAGRVAVGDEVVLV